jgi:hypothetical protein
VSPRVRENSVHPRLQSGACVRPLNFTVKLTGKSAMRTRRQQANLAKVVPNAWMSDLKFHATTKPQRADQARAWIGRVCGFG